MNESQLRDAIIGLIQFDRSADTTGSGAHFEDGVH